ncbi:Response regulator [Rhodovastum atsumiense]|uniref:Response regulator n=1 Tax=Rhodovastum atsumiense TaxID=504468 RepID=A0A5M6ISL1_9PROT|nr:response regulator [Rhodovastum atsumiense]KAA5611300.1 response regulator [Rhodovastum atsumiense]CAH2601771.1 Response regulator [Rhodovastum atsumiense]
MGESAAPGRLRVLLLEDETLIAMLAEDILIGLGCDVVGPVATVAAALRLVAAERIDAAVLDVNLGYGERGYPVADALAELGVPFAFVTGYGRDSIEARFHDRPWVQKPFGGEALAALLGTLTGRRMTLDGA